MSRHRLVQGSGWSSAEYGTGARAVFAASRCGRVIAVADAVGHEACMADAARAAVQPLLSDLDHALGSTAELVAELRPLLARINQQLRPTQASASAPSWTHAVSLAMVAYCDSGLVVANMGDTRCYSLRAGKVQSLTRGHGTVAKSIGVPPPATASRAAPLELNRIRLRRALAVADSITPDITVHALRRGDRCLLCTAGLWTRVHERALGHAWEHAGTARALLIAAFGPGGVPVKPCALAVAEYLGPPSRS